ncbi:ribosome maturation factor RimM [Chengkuizengella axinellae]|uniref:Ribosome maturation factor RimM n=1 Tax=Chengkuizengella axinellae TaxID=3064388 RepID=A0ABT9IVL7_9BACL|nr:ribosome maturation factor RimM [Chengkuizengella sp. 2205SS18-9]MDP5273415.1 ribosome maturation factor RimM [Chengkuizengella sp. 2205SS18-9]
MEENKKYYRVGKIVNTHGLRGDLKIVSKSDFPEIRFKKDSQLYVQLENENKYQALTVESARPHKEVYIVKFKGFNHINEVEKYKNSVLYVSEEQLVELPEDEYYFHEIIGCRVLTEENEELGKIIDILTPGANDVWVVKHNKGNDLLIPVIDDVLLNVNIQEKVVKIRLMEGML